MLFHQSWYIAEDDDDDDDNDDVQLDRQTPRVTACKDSLSLTLPKIAGGSSTVDG